jgi:hypothetical protein
MRPKKKAASRGARPVPYRRAQTLFDVFVQQADLEEAVLLHDVHDFHELLILHFRLGADEDAAKEEIPAPVAAVAPESSDPFSLASLPGPEPASPIPPGPRAENVVDAEIGERDIVIRLGDRAWRARGLTRNPGHESLKVNLMVRRPS